MWLQNPQPHHTSPIILQALPFFFGSKSNASDISDHPTVSIEMTKGRRSSPVVELEPLLSPRAPAFAAVAGLAVPAGDVVAGGELRRLRSLPAAVLSRLSESSM